MVLLLNRYDDEFDDASKTTTSSIFSCKSEAFETRERRAYALAVLDRPEQLMMYANTTNDVRITSIFSSLCSCSLFAQLRYEPWLTPVNEQSIASQRLRFTAMLCGFEEESDWRNNTHYKSTLSLARERQQKARKLVNVDMRED